MNIRQVADVAFAVFGILCLINGVYSYTASGFTPASGASLLGGLIIIVSIVYGWVYADSIHSEQPRWVVYLSLIAVTLFVIGTVGSIQ